MSTLSRHVSAPRGAAITCKGWPQEAALRMLMNNLDPAVAERPDDLIVYGGSGRAARSWEAFDAIVATLDGDRPPAPDIASISELIAGGSLERACAAEVK